MQIPIDTSQILEVKVANGKIIKTKGLCKDVLAVIQGYKFYVQLHMLSLGGCDVVLGTHWLSTLGVISWDFKLLTMGFLYEGQQIVLHGIEAASTSFQDASQFFKESTKKGLLVHIAVQSAAVDQNQCPAAIESLLQEFDGVFATPAGLPPLRGHEHQSNLKEGTQPLCQRPYRYPYYQKTKIEKIVKELLEVGSGSIRNSQSPFASPVLLVRIADGWHMCVDYRALNQATIKDKYPIPVIDELLDELHGASLFSKLDLRSSYHQIRMK